MRIRFIADALSLATLTILHPKLLQHTTAAATAGSDLVGGVIWTGLKSGFSSVCRRRVGYVH